MLRADRQKIILKVLDSIPTGSTGSGAEAANLHKLKSLYESCKDVVRAKRSKLMFGLTHRTSSMTSVSNLSFPISRRCLTCLEIST